MGNFNRDDRGGGRSFDRHNSGGRGFNRGSDHGGNRPMYKTVCSNCGRDCEVPFRPTNGKPVYCSNCFEKVGGGKSDSQRSDFRSPRQPQPQNQNTELLEAISTKLDLILKLLEPKTTSETVAQTSTVKDVKNRKTPKTKKDVEKLLTE
jgi:CxxC-x17-CxxC domain-containing protein